MLSQEPSVLLWFFIFLATIKNKLLSQVDLNGQELNYIINNK